MVDPGRHLASLRHCTGLSPPQRIFVANAQVLGECYMQLRRYWETNDTRKRIKLALTIYRDFMHKFFIRFWEEEQYKPKTTGVLTFLGCGRMSSLSFVQRIFGCDGLNGFVCRGTCRDWGTINPQVSMPANRGAGKFSPPLEKCFGCSLKWLDIV